MIWLNKHRLFAIAAFHQLGEERETPETAGTPRDIGQSEFTHFLNVD
jgi:hypothetical protein